MQIKNGVFMIPYGLLAGIVDGQEVRITQLGENGFQFRMADKKENIREIRLQFFMEHEHCYREIQILGDQIQSVEEKSFFTEYTVWTEVNEYQQCVQQLLSDYWNYITLKMTETDGEVAAAYTDYPVHLDEEYAESLEAQKEEWFREAAGKVKEQELSDRVEMALELDTPQLYQEWLQKSTEEYEKEYWETRGLQFHPLAKKKIERLYIGNTFCPHLCPQKEMLAEMLKKAKREQRTVTLTFPWIKEGQIEGVMDCLEFLEAQEEYLPDEMVINDWGTLHLLEKWKQKTKASVSINLGTLLSRPKKDNRLRYLNADTAYFRETGLNSGFYREYLEKHQIRRYELEVCGHDLVIPKGRHSLHLPFFQTNTAQFCTLYAKVVSGDRGRQQAIEQCPQYCRELAFLYPKHLEMFGQYNTLFGFDRKSLEEMEYLNQYIRQGIDRIVINLM